MKKMIYGVIAASALFLSACGANNASKTEESKSSKPADTALTMFDKTEDAKDSVKNSTYKMTMELTTSEQVINAKFDGEQAAKPEEKLKGEYSVKTEKEGKTSIGLYTDKTHFYVEKGGLWGDASTEMATEAKAFRRLRKIPDLSIFSRDTIKKADLKKEDGEYLIDLTVKGDELEETREDILELMSIPGSDFVKDAPKSAVPTAVRYRMTYDSKTHLLKKAEMNFTVTADNGSKVKDHIVIEYGDYNETKVSEPKSVIPE